jgi:hypothetical protein
VADKNRKTDSVVKDETVERGASKNGTLYRSATTGKYVTRSADRDPSRRACETRGWFRAAGRRFSDSADLGSCVRAFIGRYEYRGLIRGVPSDAEAVATGTSPVRLAQSMARRGFQYSRTLLKRSRRAATFARVLATRRWAMRTTRSP